MKKHFLDDKEKIKDFHSLSKEEYDLEEFCPHCSYLNKIKWDGISRKIKCSSCGEEILLCCLCNMDEVECNKCPYENK